MSRKLFFFFDILKIEYFNATKSGLYNVTETELFIVTKPVLESLFDKVADLQVRNFIEKRLQHMHFPVKFAKFLRTPFLKNNCKRLPRIFRKVLELKLNLLIIRDQSSLNDPSLLLILLSTLPVSKSCKSIGQEG